jgi:uncharacterized protein (TIGR02266 family)
VLSSLLDHCHFIAHGRNQYTNYDAREIVFRQRRIDLRVPVVFGVGGEQVVAETRNIGLGGVFVATRELPPAGQRVSLHLALPDWDESHLLSGEVRWLRGPDDNPHPVEGPGMGVRFVKLSLYVAAALDNFVRSHALDR